MAWSIAQVARMSKVTSRTLRHYDEIGLLPPARIGGNGYRYYEREQLLRLQEILVLRQFGLGLETIAEIVHDRRDRLDALRVHHRALLAERDRFARLADTVAATIAELEGGEEGMAEVNVAHWFDGLDSQTRAAYQAEAAERWGTEVVEASNQKVRGWSRRQWDETGQQWVEVLKRLVALIEDGAAANDPRVLEVIDGHYQWVSTFWTPDRESYTGLGNVYADDARFRAKFDRTHPGLAEFLRDAMTAYADARLS